MDFKSSIIQPKNYQRINIYFHPLEIGNYSIKIPFIVDSRKCFVTITAVVVVMNLELINYQDKFVDMGSVCIGKTISKTIEVINRSESSIECVFNFLNLLPINNTNKMGDKPNIKLPSNNNKRLGL